MAKQIKTPEDIFKENFEFGLQELIADKDIYLFYKDLIITSMEEYHKQFKPKKEPKPKIEIPVDKVIEFNEMFPKIKSPKTGKYLRCNITEITKSFERFFKDYDFDWPTILVATANYLDAEERKNYEWTMRSKYFVCKLRDGVNVSELAEACSRLLEGDYFEDNNERKSFEPRVL